MSCVTDDDKRVEARCINVETSLKYVAAAIGVGRVRRLLLLAPDRALALCALTDLRGEADLKGVYVLATSVEELNFNPGLLRGRQFDYHWLINPCEYVPEWESKDFWCLVNSTLRLGVRPAALVTCCG